MSRLIDADALSAKMYHDAFETDTDMQKWDSGCWIRYKMFENAIGSAPTIDAVEVVQCENCRYFVTEYAVPHCGRTLIGMKKSDYCSYGERKEE